MSKTNVKRSIARDYFYFLIIFICLAYFGIKKISKDAESQNNNQQTSSIENNNLSENGGICDVCGRKFIGRGYNETSRGIWQQTKEPYQTFICSQSCGVRHTNNWNKTLNR